MTVTHATAEHEKSPHLRGSSGNVPESPASGLFGGVVHLVPRSLDHDLVQGEEVAVGTELDPSQSATFLGKLEVREPGLDTFGSFRTHDADPRGRGVQFDVDVGVALLEVDFADDGVELRGDGTQPGKLQHGNPSFGGT